MRALGKVLTASGLVSGTNNTGVVGVSVRGFTDVKLRVGSVSGAILWQGGEGNENWCHELVFTAGCYVEVTGSGSVAVWAV